MPDNLTYMRQSIALTLRDGDDAHVTLERIQAARSVAMDEIRDSLRKLGMASGASEKDIACAIECAIDTVDDLTFDARHDANDKIEAADVTEARASRTTA